MAASPESGPPFWRPLTSVGVARNEARRHKITEVSTVSREAAALDGGIPVRVEDDDDPHRVDATLPFFEGLQPLVYMAAFFGFAPISFKPLRVSFEPRRSTLGYALCVQAFVLWSCYYAFLRRIGTLEDLAEEQAYDGGALDKNDWKRQFVAFTSIVHTICWTVTPLMWLESTRTEATAARCRQFMRQFGHLLEPDRARADRRRSWVTVVLCDMLLSSMGIVWWALVVEVSMQPSQYGSHFYSNALVSNTAKMFWFGCRRVRHMAAALAAQLQQELDCGVLTAVRVHEFQQGWHILCALNVNLVPMPVSLALLLVFVLVLITFYTYSALAQVAANWQVTAAMMTVNIPYIATLFLVYNSSHRSAETIRSNFMQVLERPRWPTVDGHVENELQKFLEVVRWNSPVVSVGGLFELNTSSFNAVIAAITTYVIVILQLQVGLPSESEAHPVIAIKSNSA